jgi:hypothetical protein
VDLWLHFLENLAILTFQFLFTVGDVVVEMILQSWDVILERDFDEPRDEHSQDRKVLLEVFPR